MRRALVLAFGLAATTGALACGDLFHSTNFETLCDVDASAPGCTAQDAGAGAPDTSVVDAATPDLNFCAFSSSDALKVARHSCAWLGACEGPFGRNAFGTCMFDALQVFDCTLRPGRQVVQGSVVHKYWQCLFAAQSCGDVDTCVYPGGVGACVDTGGYDACELDGITRIACATATKHPTFAENCAGQGRVCIRTSGSASYCAAGFDDAGVGCKGTILNDTSEDAGSGIVENLGVDCKNYGEGTCKSVNMTAACAPTGVSCSNSTLVDCVDQTHARICAGSTSDIVDCAEFQADTQCGSIPQAGYLDPAEACVGTVSACTEACSGKSITGCHNGIPFTLDCSTIPGLSSCKSNDAVPQGPDFATGAAAPSCTP